MLYLELVPREYKQLIEEATWVNSTFPTIHGINIPDVLRLTNRSYNVSMQLMTQNIPSLPHIRTIDFSEEKLIALSGKLLDSGINKVLFISGDPPPNPLQPIFKHSLPSLIKKIKDKYPSLTIYVGFDPYRQSFQAEIEYAHQKLAAGATGLFTQPLFNPHLVHILLEQCLPCEWYIGISPVLTEKAYQYWVSRNKVIFSPTFKTEMDYNVSIGKEIIKLCQDHNQHNYIMPIKANLRDYLGRLLHD